MSSRRAAEGTPTEVDSLRCETRRLRTRLADLYAQLQVVLEIWQRDTADLQAELAEKNRACRYAKEQIQALQDHFLRSERNAVMGQIAAEIGHELKNYLAVLKGRAEMIPVALGRGDLEVARMAAEFILEQAERMERISKGLMDFSSDKTDVCIFNLNGLIRRVVEFLEPTASTRGIRFRPILDRSLPHIEADRGQIEQMMLNLLKNAVDSMKQKSGRIVVKTRSLPGKEAVEISVEDEGTGVTPELAKEIFELRFSTKKGARGFGLAVCHRIATNHRGKIEMRNREGPGSVFVVTLPCR